MPPALPPPDEEDYDSAADSDFDASLSPSSGDESETTAANQGKKHRREDVDGVDRVDGDIEMGSGDEGIVAQGRKKKRRKGKGKGKGKEGDAEIAEDEEDAEDGGVGIRVRLRSGRGG